jgi:hypothetical protein
MRITRSLKHGAYIKCGCGRWWFHARHWTWIHCRCDAVCDLRELEAQ